MSLANAFIILEHDRGPVKKGDPVTVQPFAGLL
jgi:molybdopterin biosynthesis enzyme